MTNLVEYILRLKDSQFQSGIASAQASTESLSNSMNGLGAAIGVTFGVAGVVAFTKSVIEAGTSVEDARIGLTTLLKDGAEAQKVIDQTMRDAAATPFSFESLLQANRALIAAGENSEQARTDVLNLSNAIAASGGGNDELQRMVINLQQIKNEGKATAMDLRQFSYAGINLYAALDAAGLKHAKGTELTYEQISYALQKANEAGGIYYHGLENMAENTSIKVSNLGDAWFQFRVEIFDKLKPTIDKTVTALISVVNWLKENKEGVISFGKALMYVAGGFTAYKIAVGLAIPVTTSFGIAANAALGPIGLLISAVTALAYAYDLSKNAAQKARDAYKEEQEKEKNQYVGNLNAVKKILTDRGIAEQDATKKISEEFKKRGEIALLSAQTEMKQWDSVKKSGVPLSKYDIENISKVSEKISDAQAMIAAADEFIKPKPKETSALKKGGAAKPPATDKLEKATGQKAVTINVSINDLIHDFTIQTTNITESAQKVKEMVTNALLDAINNSQMIPIR